MTTYKDKYIWEAGKDFVMADFHNLSLYMAGVFTPKDPAYRNVILTGRTFLQEVEDRRGIANQIFVKLDDRTFADAAKTQIEGLNFPVKIHVESAQEAMDQAMDDLNDMLRYAAYVILFASLVILICIANTISMSTFDRTQEFGILRALGFERPRVMKLVLLESVFLGLMGGALGCVAAFLMLSLGHQDLAVRGFTIPLKLRPELLGAGIGVSLLVGLLGGLLPAIRASRMRIVESLRKAD
ncbi:MAG: ABC transporter permease [Planctomycetes bacterium]|nr:ABC transporter permease [Planctomycetota bacterium]